ncbi:hexitol phosphatase HxpB [uncultured Cyclobacterium sp.]|uniref:hexitol phosphatase HxpB n=1 Tax=uncultured Cyclobacterium sp. TaxID=453820 RepID=UPI0030EB9EBC|tara:strand:+ start:29232 stop:29870 length:639 start_codon:yes stop_codon:yes gene_type:complete
MNCKAFIFDMDGVLVDSEGYWKQAEFEVFTALGVKVTDEGALLTKSMTTIEVVRFWYNKFPWETVAFDTVEQLVISRVIAFIEAEDCLIAGVKPFIEKLKKDKYKIGLATNSPNRIIPVVLKKLGVLHLFDATLSAEHELKGKPDPAIYQSAADKLGAKPEQCIVIEDSYSGMLAAKSAGMKVIAFTYKGSSIKFEIADFQINSFEGCEIDF